MIKKNQKNHQKNKIHSVKKIKYIVFYDWDETKMKNLKHLFDSSDLPLAPVIWSLQAVIRKMGGTDTPGVYN